MYELAIIGGGPAGVAAGVYASRKQIKTIFLTKDFGGQSIVSDGIENWIGDIKISGFELSKKFQNHLKHYAGDFVDIKTNTLAENISKQDDGSFLIKTTNGEFTAKSVLINTGSKRRKIDAINSDKFEHKGVNYCATCDGPLFQGMDVAVIGGGNSALEGVQQLLNYAKSVTLIHRSNEFRADPITIKSIENNPNLNILKNSEVTEIMGDKMVSGLKYKNSITNEEHELSLQGVFVEIGSLPNTELVSGLVELDKSNHIKIDPWNQRTNIEGIWSAGDCTNVLYHQNNIAAGDAVKALEDIYIWLKNLDSA